LGDIPLNKLTLPIIRKGLAKLASEGRNGKTLGKRSLNYYVTGILNVLNRAKEDGWIRSNPIPPKTLWQKLPRPERPLFTDRERIQLCSAAIEHCPRNGQQLSDLINFMCYCGSRVSVTLRLRWADVDWENNQIIIARDGDSKNKSSRRVGLNKSLKPHLLEMLGRRANDEYLFPSGQRGSEKQRARCFNSALRKAREKAGLGSKRKKSLGNAVSFHDCRHFFASMCTMHGVSHALTAEWLGHSDGGMLVGRVYSHLSPEYKRDVAENLTLGPVVIDGGVKAA
jgi:integrase